MNSNKIKVFFVLETQADYSEKELKEKLQNFFGDGEKIEDMWFQEYNPSGADEEIEQYQEGDLTVTIYQRGDTLGTKTPAFLARIKGSVKNRGCVIEDDWDAPITYTSLEIIKRAVSQWVSGRHRKMNGTGAMPE